MFAYAPTVALRCDAYYNACIYYDQAKLFRYTALEDSEGRVPSSPLIPGFGLLQDGCRLGMAGNASISGATILLEFASEQSMNGWYFVKKAENSGTMRRKSPPTVGPSSGHNSGIHGGVILKTVDHHSSSSDESHRLLPTSTRSHSSHPAARSSNHSMSPTVTRFRIEAWDGVKSTWTTVGAPAWTHSGGLQFFDQTKRDVKADR